MTLLWSGETLKRIKVCFLEGVRVTTDDSYLVLDGVRIPHEKRDHLPEVGVGLRKCSAVAILHGRP